MPFVPSFVTFATDTFLSRVSDSVGVNHTGKTRDKRVRVQLSCDLLGRVIHVFGPCPGKSYDAHIFQQSEVTNPFRMDGEFGLGDGHYSSVGNFVTHRLGQGSIGNVMIQLYRARIEHVNSKVFKAHALFEKTWTGSLDLFCALVKIAIHAANVLFRTKIQYPLAEQSLWRAHKIAGKRVWAKGFPAPNWIWTIAPTSPNPNTRRRFVEENRRKRRERRRVSVALDE